MDILLENELTKIPKEKNNDINEFIKEIQNSLNDPKNKISIDESFYNEIYSDMQLASKYKGKLDEIIKECMLDYSFDTEFIYVNYDAKSKKYYMDIYDGDITKVEVTKSELEKANIKVGSFYFSLNDGKYLEEKAYIKEDIKEKISEELKRLEKNYSRRKDV